ncbi:MAG: hypothetical protein A2W19_03530 [Spirochaetes bacterium RBG_16_49_21]|nr:MAG: hypothetical protein A2W19_03530 [Spirochaetes bacterium RBG_16_49_21]
MAHGKPFTLYRRNRIYYCRFKLPDGSWSTARSTGETARGRAEAWAINYLQQGKIVVRENITLSEFSKDFFAYSGQWAIDRRVAGIRNTQRQCLEKTRILTNKILPALGKMRLIQIDKSVIKSFRNDLFQNGLAGSTINHILSCLKVILEHAEEKNLIQSMPRIERAAARTKHRGILTVEEVRRLFSIEWGDVRSYVMNLAAACTGLRRGELVALTMQEIHGNYITVSHSWDERLRILNPTTKTGRARTVIIPGKLQEEIQRLINLNPWGKPDSFVFFSTMADKPVEGSFITDSLYRALQKIGISEQDRQERNITFHSWRHWFNSLLINAKIPLQKIQSLTGHLTAEMTQHYYHADELSDVAQVIQDSLFATTAHKSGKVIN